MPEPGTYFDPLDRLQRNDRLHHFSHALKNRMGSLWQAAALLHDLPEGPERRQLLELAERNFFNGAAELERLMDDFGVPRGITGIERVPVDLPGVVQECIGNIGFRTQRKGQQVNFRSAGPVQVQGDRTVLMQLFEALLANASKFSPKDSLITVALATENSVARVSVRDRGVGLSGQDLDQVFVRYAMLASRSTEGESQARSTLARAKQWAGLHGGSLEATSEGPGKGAMFTVRLPLG